MKGQKGYREQAVVCPQFTQQGSGGKCDVRAGDGILWKCPLIPLAKFLGNTVDVGARQAFAYLTHLLNVTRFLGTAHGWKLTE